MIRAVLDLARLTAMSPDEAAALLAARRLDGAEFDAPVLAAWLDADPDNVRAWADATRALAAFEAAETDDLIAGMLHVARAARPERVPAGRIAAAIAVFFCVGALAIGVVGWPGSKNAPPAAGTVYATGEGQRRALVLPDGTAVTLEANSRLQLAYTPARRALSLSRGGASFAVAHDATRPFAVRAGGREVIALGTRFEVRVDVGRLDVVLQEGRVSVGAVGSATPIVLRPGQHLVAVAGEPPTVSSEAGPDAGAAPKGLITFRDSTLAEAAIALNRDSPVALLVRDPKVASLRISGTFRAGDPARFARSVAQIHPVKIMRRSSTQLELVPAAR